MAELYRYTVCTDPDDPVGTDTGEEFATFEQAREHARQHRLAVVEHVYEWQGSVPVQCADYRPDPDQQDRDELRGDE